MGSDFMDFTNGFSLGFGKATGSYAETGRYWAGNKAQVHTTPPVVYGRVYVVRRMQNSTVAAIKGIK